MKSFLLSAFSVTAAMFMAFVRCVPDDELSIQTMQGIPLCVCQAVVAETLADVEARALT